MSDFAVVIPTYGRYDRVYTIDALKKHGYTGNVYLLCDDSDEQLSKYIDKFGEDKVLIFSKDSVVGKFDRMDNLNKRNVVVYARNAIYEASKKAGLRYIAVLDDDYNCFEWRVDKDFKYCKKYVYSLDKVFNVFLEFLKKTKIRTICFAQSGDFIGGKHNQTLAVKKSPKRKMMNLFFFDVDNPVEFMGTINEDLTASVAQGIVGGVVLTCPLITLNQKATQQNAGGLTEIYLDLGTYVKSFYSVMYAPSAVKVALMGNKDKRLHHKVSWKNCSAKIIRGNYDS